MGNKTIYTRKNLLDYLNHFYLSTYCTIDMQAFYNARNRQHILVNRKKENFSKSEIILMFAKDKATDLPTEIELCRFQLFLYEQNNR